MSEQKKTFQTGAVRRSNSEDERWDLVPIEGLRRAAQAAAVGAKEYGNDNWKKGMPLSEFLNHALQHIYKYLDGDKGEDHLGHAAWDIMAACHAEREGWNEQDGQKTAEEPETRHGSPIQSAFEKAIQEEGGLDFKAGDSIPDFKYKVGKTKKKGLFYYTKLMIGRHLVELKTDNEPTPEQLTQYVYNFARKLISLGLPL